MPAMCLVSIGYVGSANTTFSGAKNSRTASKMKKYADWEPFMDRIPMESERRDGGEVDDKEVK